MFKLMNQFLFMKSKHQGMLYNTYLLLSKPNRLDKKKMKKKETKEIQRKTLGSSLLTKKTIPYLLIPPLLTFFSLFTSEIVKQTPKETPSCFLSAH